jgi:signal transduction histidine kinase
MGWIYSQIVPAWEAQAYIAVYLGFQAFAHVVVRAALSEAAARDDLARTHVELSAKEALLAESQRLADRARIGQDLHDVLGHHLAAMSLNLEVASHLTDGDAKGHVDQARQLTQLLLDDVREVVTELRSENGYDLGEVVRRIAADMPSPAIHVAVAPAVRVVADAAKAEALIRCVQELITNAVRHAGAANLWIALEPRDGGVELSARDDGDGVDPIVRGVGLTGLEQRFARLGGRFTFSSARGAGFKVAAWLP